jgi:hypothetical protein
MRSVFTHAAAVFTGVALGAAGLAFAGSSAMQSAPTHADMTRVVAELHELNISAKGLNNTTYGGFWKLCRTQLHFSIDDSASIRRWCD